MLFLRCSLLVVALSLLTACGPSSPAKKGSPLDELPGHITVLLDSGLRPDWASDSQRLLFLDALVGNAFELTLASREVRPLTSHFAHQGFTRARYLSNGDILLCGPEKLASRADRGRWHTALWWLAGDLSQPAQSLGVSCFEGPAVSRRDMTIAWTESDYPDEVVFGRSEIWLGEIAITDRRASLINKRKILDRSALNYLAFFESQDFRQPDERELLITAYAYRGGEVMGLNLSTGSLRNYSKNMAYDEAEGIFPDGHTIAVEREPGTFTLVPKGHIDIWQTDLDGSGNTRRLTHFSDYTGYGANNPVISPDGRWMAFSLRLAEGDHGNGQGILLMDLTELP